MHYSVLLRAVDFRRLAALVWCRALIMIGVCLAGARAHILAEPVLGFRYYGPIQGRIVNVDRSGSDTVRLTLDQVVLPSAAAKNWFVGDIYQT